PSSISNLHSPHSSRLASPLSHIYRLSYSFPFLFFFFFFFNDPATTEIYTLSLHDALPIFGPWPRHQAPLLRLRPPARKGRRSKRSEEHTSELQSLTNLVCRLLLEKKKTNHISKSNYDDARHIITL